jgi:DNA mismatch repair protein MutS2
VRVTQVAGTPSLISPVASADTLEQLEFGRALALVAGHAVSELGAAAVRARRPARDVESVREALALVGELLSAFHDGCRFAPRAVPDLSELIRVLATAGSVLEAAALVELGDALEAMRETHAGLAALGEDAPRVAALAAAVEVPPLRLQEAIARSLERDGRVKDEASPGLKRARRHVRDVRARLVALLDRLAPAGGESGVTLRGERYVIPVRREARGSVKGIVHGESSSGATLFVEPAEAVELGNELNAAESEEAREVLAVLRGLTEQAREVADRIEAGWRMSVAADDVYARARYALEVDAVVPDVVPAPGPLRLARGFHPVIRADAGSAVPFDLVLDASERTVVVSGPNAGGKTVLLKAVGLAAALAQSGVVPPVGKGTRLPVFRRLFADIGDHQSIEASLSTFSAHVAALRSVLEDADDASLVLLDELGGGTDPVEGAALAQGVLLSLHGRRAVTIATTHLGQLKELAAGTAGVVNASLEFDAETLAPTYRFIPGKPGRSYALAIARRLGLPADVLSIAEAATPEAARTLEATLAELERREAELARREVDVDTLGAKLERELQSATHTRSDIERREAALRGEERELERSGREQARKFLLEARKRVEEAIALARSEASEAAAKEARRRVEEGVREEGKALRTLEDVARAKGWKVRGAAAREMVVEMPPSSNRRERDPVAMPAVQETLDVAAASEIDLRGMRVEEAEAAVAAAIDGAVVADLPTLRIIHGKGTGALRSVVQAMLQHDRRVASFNLAPPQQGGSGVTVVAFA